MNLYQVTVDCIIATVFAEDLEDLANELNNYSNDDEYDPEYDIKEWSVSDGKLIWTMDDYTEECSVNIIDLNKKGVIHLEAH